MKTIKFVIWLVLVLVVITIGAAFAVAKFIDPNEYKPKISQLVEEKTGRKLNLDGNLELTWYPWLGVETGALALSNAQNFGEDPMIAVDNARVKIKLMPLLKKQIEVDTIVLDGPQIRLHTQEDGTTNWQDLMSAAGAKSESSGSGGQNAGAIAGLAVQGVSIVDGQVWWQDDRAGQSLKLDDLDLSTGKLVPGAPLDVELSVNASGNVLPEPALIKLKTTVTLSENMESAALDDASLSVGMESIAADLSVDKLSYAIQAGLAAVNGVEAEVEKDGVKSSLVMSSINFNMSEQTLELPSLQVKQDDAAVDLSLSGRDFLTNPAVAGKFNIQSGDLAAMLKRNGLDIALPDISLGDLVTQGSYQFADNVATLSDFSFDAKINQLPTRIETPSVTYNVGTQSFATPLLKILQDDFTFTGKLNAANLLSGLDSMNLQGQIDTAVSDIAGLLSRNGVDLSLPDIPLQNIRLNTSFEMAAGNLVAESFDAGFDHHQQPTRISIPYFGLNMTDGSLKLNSIDIEQGDFSLTGTAEGNAVIPGLDKMKVGGRLTVKAGDIVDLLARNRIEVEIPEGVVKSIETDLSYQLANNSLKIDKLNAKIDEITLKGNVAVNNLAKPGYQFDLAINQLDVDKLTSSGDEAATAGTSQPSTAEQLLFPVAPLKGIKIDGKASIGKLITTGMTLEDVRLVVQSDKDVLRVAPVTAKVFGGQIETQLAYDVSRDIPSIRLINKVSKVQMGDLLTALEITEKISGTGNLTTNLSGQGLNPDQLIASLDGDIGFRLIDGAIKGYDLQATLLKLQSEIAKYKGKEETSAAEPDAETKFAELSGTFQVQDGVFRNQDLDMKAPLFRVNGQGALDLPKSRIDYKVAVNVVNSVEGQGGSALKELKGEKIP